MYESRSNEKTQNTLKKDYELSPIIGIPQQALFTLKEAAEIFKVHVRTIERWIEDERLEAIVLPGGKSLRITYEEIVKIFSQNTTSGDMKRR